MEHSWIVNQIQNEINRGNRPDAVRDLASLLIVEMFLSGKLDQVTGGDTLRHYGVKNAAAGVYSIPPTAHYAKHLTREQAEHWVQNMHSSDHHGGKWKFDEIKQYAQNYGVTGEQKVIDFFAIMNAMYSDYHKVARKFGVDKTDFYAELAKAFLDDDDAVEGKARVYYECIAGGMDDGTA